MNKSKRNFYVLFTYYFFQVDKVHINFVLWAWAFHYQNHIIQLFALDAESVIFIGTYAYDN